MWGFRAQTNAAPGSVAGPLMRQYAERAAQIDESDARVQGILGRIAYQEHRFAEAEIRARRALHLAPGDINAVILLATIRGILGDFEEAIELTERGVKLDPLSPFNRMLNQCSCT